MRYDEIRTMDDVRAFYDHHIGGHWFESDTMQFFRTRLQRRAPYRGPGGVYFVTSEAPSAEGKRLYTVRRVERTGHITTAGPFYEDTHYEAHQRAERLARTHWAGVYDGDHTHHRTFGYVAEPAPGGHGSVVTKATGHGTTYARALVGLSGGAEPGGAADVRAAQYAATMGDRTNDRYEWNPHAPETAEKIRGDETLIELS